MSGSNPPDIFAKSTTLWNGRIPTMLLSGCPHGHKRQMACHHRRMADILSAPSAHEHVAAIRAGLPSHVFDDLLEQLGLTTSELSSIIRVAERTIQRRKKDGHFPPDESDRIFRIVVLIDRAEQVLGAGGTAWLTTPNHWFAGETPLQFADTETGGREVLQALGRLEHGVFL